MATLLLCGADWTSTAPSPLGEPVIESGEFRAHMEVESVNDGPVTLLLDSRKAF